MSKSIKKLFTALLAAVAVFTLAFGFTSLTTQKAMADITNGLGVETGAYFRVPQTGEDTNYYGIGFTGTITKSQYDANANAATEKVIYGMEIAPVDDLTAAVDVLAGTTDSLKVTFEDGAEYGTFFGSLVNLKDENLTRPMTARSYYVVDGGAKEYGDWLATGKTLFAMSTYALADTEATDTARLQALNGIIDKVTDTSKTGHYVVDSFAVTAPTGKTILTLANDDIITVTATVKSSVDASRTLEVLPKVELLNANGEAFTDDSALTLVAGTKNQYKVNITNYGAFKVKITVGNATQTVDCKTLITLKKGNDSHSGNIYTNYAKEVTPILAPEDDLKISFTGKNIPNVRLFSENPDTDNFYAADSKGYMFGFANNVGTARFYACGPNSSVDQGWFGRGTTSDNQVFQSPSGNDAIAYGNLNDNTSYVLSIKYVKEDTAISLNVSLAKADGTSVASHSFTLSDEYAVSLLSDGKSGYPVLLFGNDIADISFEYEIKSAWTDINKENVSLLQSATSGWYRLTEDITLTGTWTKGKNFSGILDGQGHKISGLSLSGNTQGMFNELQGCTIKNIIIEGTVGGNNNGLLATRTRGTSYLENVIIKANLGSYQYAGGLFYIMDAGSVSLTDVIIISTSTNSKEPQEAGFISGRASTNYKVNVDNCYFIAANNITASGTSGSSGHYAGAYGTETGKTYLCATQEDANNYKYTKFFVGTNYKVYYDASSLATAESAFIADDTKVLGTALTNLWNAYKPTNP